MNRSNPIRYWSSQEELDLEHEIRLQTPFEEIASKHGRSVRAIEYRFALLLQKKQKKGEKEQELAHYYNVHVEQIKHYLKLDISPNSDFGSKNTEITVRSDMDGSRIMNEKIKILENKVEKLEKLFKKLYCKKSKNSKDKCG
jgi:hypothetical protein